MILHQKMHMEYVENKNIMILQASAVYWEQGIPVHPGNFETHIQVLLFCCSSNTPF